MGGVSSLDLSRVFADGKYQSQCVLHSGHDRDVVTDEMEQAHQESCGTGNGWIAEWIAATVSC